MTTDNKVVELVSENINETSNPKFFVKVDFEVVFTSFDFNIARAHAEALDPDFEMLCWE